MFQIDFWWQINSKFPMSTMDYGLSMKNNRTTKRTNSLYSSTNFLGGNEWKVSDTKTDHVPKLKRTQKFVYATEPQKKKLKPNFDHLLHEHENDTAKGIFHQYLSLFAKINSFRK